MLVREILHTQIQTETLPHTEMCGLTEPLKGSSALEPASTATAERDGILLSRIRKGA
jgi:hypothetical protein